MARARKSVQEEVRFDMTPLIDVVFLLIIFFLCIDFRVLEAKLPANLPKHVGAHPNEVEPQETLSIRIVCDNRGEQKRRSESSYWLDGHRVHWQVGPEPIHGLDRLVTRLEEIARDPSKKRRDPTTGEMKPVATVIEPLPDTTYGDVALTVDAVTRAGFDEITFGGGYGRVKTDKK